MIDNIECDARHKKNCNSSKKKEFIFKNIFKDFCGKTYAIRYGISFGFFGIHLFNIKIPYEQHLHDHPYDFISLVVGGGILKEIKKPNGLSKIVKHTIFNFSYSRANEAQKIINVCGKNGAWILILCGSKYRNWGYHTFEGWIDNETYNQWKKKGCLPQF